MKNLLATTALVLSFGTAAIAENHTSMFSDTPFDASINLYASDLLGARVYASEAEMDASVSVTADTTTEWDDIGEINDIILTRDGDVQTVIVGVGGFLGMGEKDVAINMSDIKFISDGESADDYFLVVNASVAGLEEAPSFERTQMREELNEAEAEVEKTAEAVEAEAEQTAEAVEAEAEQAVDNTAAAAGAMVNEIKREGYVDAEMADLNTEDLTGARVYGINDEDVGEVSELLLTDDGQIDRAVIDVGGFLGLGEHSVAVSMDELKILRENNTGEFRVFIDSTEGKLEEMPEYEG